MYTLIAYKRTPQGEKGPKVFKIEYPTREQLLSARNSLMSLRTLKNIRKSKGKNNTILVPCDIESKRNQKEVKFENYIFFSPDVKL